MWKKLQYYYEEKIASVRQEIETSTSKGRLQKVRGTRLNKKDGGMSILKPFFLKIQSTAKTLKEYLTNHRNFPSFPLKLF